MSSSPAHLVLAACAEPFVSGGRALVFGNAGSPLAEELVERGARLVHVFDPDAARAAASAEKNRIRQVAVSPEDAAEGALKPGAFDVALVPDLTVFASPSAVLGLVRRALSSRGVAFVAAPNTEAKTALFGAAPEAERKTPLGYYELYDAVSAAFPEVIMLGQTPFVGYAVVDFAADGDQEVAIDSNLVPGGAEEPEWFVACASSEATSFGAIHIVQLPATSLVTSLSVAAPPKGPPPGPDPKTLEELRAARAAEAHLIERVARLEVELGRAQAELAGARATALPKERVLDLERELSARDERLAVLQAELSSRDVRAQNAERAESEKRELEARLERRNAEIELLTRATVVEGPDETERLEGLLKEQGQRLRQLTSELSESERVGKELVFELQKTRSAQNGGAGVTLATENARLKADLESAGWTISELEDRLRPEP